MAILIVEDDYLIAQNLEDELTEAGFSVLGPAGSVSDAMAIIDEGGQPDAAILDVNLGDETSFSLADMLAIAGIPFVFATGYGAEFLPEKFAGRPVVTKPCVVADLVDVVRNMPIVNPTVRH